MSKTEEFKKKLEGIKRVRSEDAGDTFATLASAITNNTYLVQFVMNNSYPRLESVIGPVALNVLGRKQMVTTQDPVIINYCCVAGVQTILNVNGRDLTEHAAMNSGLRCTAEGDIVAVVDAGCLYAIAVSISKSVGTIMLGAKLLEFDTSTPGNCSLKRATYFEKDTCVPVFFVNYKEDEITEIVTYDPCVTDKFLYNGVTFLQPGFAVDTSSFFKNNHVDGDK